MSETDKEQIQLAIEQALIALSYYGDPDIYKGILILPDPPCGDFINDVSMANKDYSPGQLARAAIELAQSHGYAANTAPDKAWMQAINIDLKQRYPVIEKDERCCNLQNNSHYKPLVIEKAITTCPFCNAPKLTDQYIPSPENRTDYLCGMSLYDCGHYQYNLFDRDEICQHIQKLSGYKSKCIKEQMPTTVQE